MVSIDDEIRAFGEALPELGSALISIPVVSTAIAAYKRSDLIVAIPLTLLETCFAYALYKGILRGDLFNRWAGYKYSDPLKTLYNKIKS